MSGWITNSEFMYWPEDLDAARPHKLGNNVWLTANFREENNNTDGLDVLPFVPYILGPGSLEIIKANFACPRSWIVA